MTNKLDELISELTYKISVYDQHGLYTDVLNLLISCKAALIEAKNNQSDSNSQLMNRMWELDRVKEENNQNRKYKELYRNCIDLKQQSEDK